MADEKIPIASQIASVAISASEQRIAKVGDNRVRVSNILKDKDGKDVVLAKQDFGTDQITQNLANIQSQIDAIKEPNYVKKATENLEAQKIKWTELKTAMEGAVTQ